MLDYVITRSRDVGDVLLTRVMRGAECWTDHRLVTSNFQLKIRPPIHKLKAAKRLNVRACKDPEKQDDLLRAISEALVSESQSGDSPSSANSQSLTDEWSSFSSLIMDAATVTLGFSTRKHQDWFDDSLPQIRSLLHEKNVAHDASLRNPGSASLRSRW